MGDGFGQNKAIDIIGKCPIWGGGCLERFYLCAYSQTSLNKLAMGPTLKGPFREVVALWSSNTATIVLLHGR